MDKSFKTSLAEMIAYMGNKWTAARTVSKSGVNTTNHKKVIRYFIILVNYEPVSQTITLNTNGRHPKDILRYLCT